MRLAIVSVIRRAAVCLRVVSREDLRFGRGGGGRDQARRKMAEAVDLAKLHSKEPAADALATCAQAAGLAKVTWPR